MLIDKTAFLVMVTTFAAGGAGGYVAARKNVFQGPPAPDTAQATTQLTADPNPPKAVAATPSAEPAPAPVCDDTSGAAGDCPPPSSYSAEEGGCGALPVKRCNDFKKALKPKVASQAVACLNALKPYERCDEKRSNLCGHVALMSACVEPESTKATTSTNSAIAATTTAPASDAGASSAAAACDAIALGCAGNSMTPSVRDCRATLSGMTEAGRKGTIECMKTHCSDKGLLGCEVAVGAT